MIELTEEKVSAFEAEMIRSGEYWKMRQNDDPPEGWEKLKDMPETGLALIAHWRETNWKESQAAYPKEPVCRHCKRIRSEHWGVNAHCDSDCLPTKTVFTPV